ncbi:MAG: hypothetical protein OXI01_13820 [Albidovulum sp.]|nr:hypothetical protein [Albidovulum sp.]
MRPDDSGRDHGAGGVALGAFAGAEKLGDAETAEGDPRRQDGAVASGLQNLEGLAGRSHDPAPEVGVEDGDGVFGQARQVRKGPLLRPAVLVPVGLPQEKRPVGFPPPFRLLTTATCIFGMARRPFRLPRL